MSERSLSTSLQRQRRGLELFDRANAVDMHDTPMQRPPQLDEPAIDAMPEFSTGKGTVAELLYGDPESPDDGGMSLVLARFGANFHLPRHSHSVDCLYYVVSGELRMGNRVVKAGGGFFAPADAPYGYVAGPDGVDVLEFRARSAYDSQIHESPAGWTRILEAVRANREAWAEELAPHR
jgi:mannose-6-phosphate isomerase-like protein (cupin superfamily)